MATVYLLKNSEGRFFTTSNADVKTEYEVVGYFHKAIRTIFNKFEVDYRTHKVLILHN